MNKEIILSSLAETDLEEILFSFKQLGWNKPKSLYETYLAEQTNNIRSIIVGKKNEKFFGYVTIKWESAYPFFKSQKIPEISDLNVLPNYRNIGLGSMLIATCENRAKEKMHTHIGLGVGMTVDYGSAQRLYVKSGFIPDGYGLHYQNRAVLYGDKVTVDDDLVMYLVKQLV